VARMRAAPQARERIGAHMWGAVSLIRPHPNVRAAQNLRPFVLF
jgi:hypothetical protein